MIKNLHPNEIENGQKVIAENKIVAIVDAPPESKVTILHFTDGSLLPLNNKAVVAVEVDVTKLTLDAEAK